MDRGALRKIGVDCGGAAMAFVRANGGVVHYADEGPRAARPIVFINSLGTDFRIWDEVAKPLAQECADHPLRQTRARPFRTSRRRGFDRRFRDRSRRAARSPARARRDDRRPVDRRHDRAGALPSAARSRLLRWSSATPAIASADRNFGRHGSRRSRRAASRSIADGVMQRWFTQELPRQMRPTRWPAGARC